MSNLPMDRTVSRSVRSLLSTSKLFTVKHDLPPREQATLSFERAKCFVRAFALTRTDIEELTHRYWQMHIDPVLSADCAAATLLTIQLNLVAGTIATYARNRPDLSSLLDKIINFDVSGQFLLTEVDHGLDAINLETTATLLPNGGFVLCTPHSGAAKCMPPAIPCGTPAVGIVYARLMAGGQSKGVYPFIVPLNDGTTMCPGITARPFPYRGGSNPVNHSLTSFTNVHLPPSSLLRPVAFGEESSASQRLDFLASLWRVAVGSLSLSSFTIPALQIAAFITARHSQRRTVAIPGGRVPLITFTTSHIPVLTALARSFVLNAFFKYAVNIFCNKDIDFRVRHGVVTAIKVVAIQHVQEGNLELSERCGNQGLFGHNQIYSLHAELRGVAIAEGDLLGLSIRLVPELLLGRYELPESTHSSSPLAQHESSLFASNRAIILSMSHHRASDFNDRILPHCQAVVEAIGLRMAYDAALDAGLDKRITDVYLATAIGRDPAWYSEHLDITQERQVEMRRVAFQAALPMLDEWLQMADVEEYVSAPIVSAEKWKNFVDGLEVFEGPSVKPLNSDELDGRLRTNREYIDVDKLVRAHL